MTHEQNEKTNKETENIKENKTETLEQKNTIIEPENWLGGVKTQP